jgi:hypothetical protein
LLHWRSYQCCRRFRWSAFPNVGELVWFSLHIYWLWLFYSIIRCWEPKVLQKMSSHYQTKEPLSEELIQKIIKRWLMSENSGGWIEFLIILSS